MKRNVGILAALLWGAGAWCLCQGGDNILQLNNTISFGYDDNYYQANTNKTSTFEIMESPELVASINRENTYLSLRYNPNFTWYTGTNIERRYVFQNQLDANWNQTLSPRLNFTLAEIFRAAQQPELLDRNNALIYPNQSYIENTLNGNLGIQLQESLTLNFSGRMYLLNYDNLDVGTNGNYTIFSGGFSLRQEVSKATAVSLSFNDDNTTYKEATVRGANTVSAGLGVDHTFSPRLLGSIAGGWQLKSFQLASINGQNSPYWNFSLTYIFDPRLRLTAGAGYSLWEADIGNYASQERLSGFASLGYDISTRLSFYLSGGVTHGTYLADQVAIPGNVFMEGANQTSVTGQTAQYGGVDVIYQASARLAYQFNRSNFVDLNYSYSTLNSDLRPNFYRNIYGVDWRISF